MFVIDGALLTRLSGDIVLVVTAVSEGLRQNLHVPRLVISIQFPTVVCILPEVRRTEDDRLLGKCQCNVGFVADDVFVSVLLKFEADFWRHLMIYLTSVASLVTPVACQISPVRLPL